MNKLLPVFAFAAAVSVPTFVAAQEAPKVR